MTTHASEWCNGMEKQNGTRLFPCEDDSCLSFDIKSTPPVEHSRETLALYYGWPLATLFCALVIVLVAEYMY